MKNALISNDCIDKFNQALYQEMYVSHLYRHIANQLQILGYLGSYKFFKHESEEEIEHYQKIADFLNDVGVLAEMPMIDKCDEKIEGIVDAIEVAYESEVSLLEFYTDFYKTADPTCQQILLEFIEIQRKSAGLYGDYSARLAVINGDTCGLIIFDQELANGL